MSSEKRLRNAVRQFRRNEPVRYAYSANLLEAMAKFIRTSNEPEVKAHYSDEPVARGEALKVLVYANS